MYEYAATVERVIDGDTVDVTIDLGFRVYLGQRIRLAGIDAPEVSTDEGKDARDFLRRTLPPGQHVVLTTERPRDDKYGRFLATVMKDGTLNINNYMLNTGHARPYDGGAR